MMSTIRVFALGDIVGRPGRNCLQQSLHKINDELKPDIFICNGENAAGGFGLTKKVFTQLTNDFGVDVVTTGNHWADKPQDPSFYQNNKQLLLPANMYNVDNINRGLYLARTRTGVRFAVFNLLGRLFMKGDNSCPFLCINKLLDNIDHDIKVRILDFHAETTSEKQAMAHYLAKKFSLVYGTHTHCPTADERILQEYTGFISDVGMSGAYDSVIGMSAESSLSVFLQTKNKKLVLAKHDLRLCGLYATIDVSSGKCTSIKRIQWLVNE